jgi:RNA polymerase-binding transcription factor DksA
MPNKWIEHVKSYASKHKMSYRDALKDPKCKHAYQSVKGTGPTQSKVAPAPTPTPTPANVIRRKQIEAWKKRERKKLASIENKLQRIETNLKEKRFQYKPEVRKEIFNLLKEIDTYLLDSQKLINNVNPKELNKNTYIIHKLYNEFPKLLNKIVKESVSERQNRQRENRLMGEEDVFELSDSDVDGMGFY